MVADFEHLVASGDGGAAPAGHGAEEELPLGLELRADLAEPPAGDRRTGADHATDHQQIAFRHRVDLVGTGEVHELEDLLGGVGIWVDHHVGAHGGQEARTRRPPQLLGLDAHDRLRDAAPFARSDAIRLTSSFWVTPASRAARPMPARSSTDG